MAGAVEYSAIQSAVNRRACGMAAYFKGTSIRVNCLGPGCIVDGQPASFLTACGKHCSSKAAMLEPEGMVPLPVLLQSNSSHRINGRNAVGGDGFII